MKSIYFTLLFLAIVMTSFGQRDDKFNGLNLNLGNLYRLLDSKTRSISPGNITGEPGKSRYHYL